jgi:hypothetical protein
LNWIVVAGNQGAKVRWVSGTTSAQPKRGTRGADGTKSRMPALRAKNSGISDSHGKFGILVAHNHPATDAPGGL